MEDLLARAPGTFDTERMRRVKQDRQVTENPCRFPLFVGTAPAATPTMRVSVEITPAVEIAVQGPGGWLERRSNTRELRFKRYWVQ